MSHDDKASFRPQWRAIDHVQLAMPVGGEESARSFYVAHAGLTVRWSDEIAGTVRCHLDDPFGNRLELMEG